MMRHWTARALSLALSAGQILAGIPVFAETAATAPVPDTVEAAPAPSAIEVAKVLPGTSACYRSYINR